ncbi:MAG TPA: AMP-binding protein [Myxococcales bacterium]|nr:AMP-binding protein [Myxococcales bacterium]
MLDVSQTFRDRSLVLTGATGFLGKVVLSMLLDRYPEIGQVLVLARPGTSASAEARFFDQVLPSHPFDPLREKHGTSAERFFREKIRVLDGDVTDPDLGLDEAIVAELSRAKVAAVLNCAGLVSFDPSLELALGVNSLGPAHAAGLCRKIGAPLVHVSTCFVAGERQGPVFEDEPVVGSYPRQRELDGASLDVPREIEDCQKLIAQARQRADDGALAATFRADAMERLREEGRDPADARALKLAVARERKLWLANELVRLGMERARHWGWPNTYTFSKSLGEQLIAGTAGLSYALARPSIVESALRYPFPGWNEGFTTSAPLAFLGLKGHRSLPAGERCILDLIPVDLVAAGLLAITAAAAAGEQDPVYQLASGDVNPFFAARAVELVGLYRRRVYRRKETGRPFVNKLASRLEIRPVSRARYEWTSAPMARRVARGLSALIAESRPRWGAPRVSALADRAKEALDGVAREVEGITDLIDLFLPFLWENSYIFRCDRTRALADRLAPADREKLPWDPEKLEWRHYFMDVHMAGLERWVFPGLEEERDAQRRPGRAHRDLLELFFASTEAHAERVAFRYVEGEDRPEVAVTYAQARTRAVRVAAHLAAAGVKPGDRVLLSGDNRPEWPIGYFGILLAGAVAVPLDPQLSDDEVRNLARASGARVGLCGEETGKAGEELPDSPVSSVATKDVHWLALEAATARPFGASEPAFDRPAISPDDPASLIFTSGTTGKPKGVLLSHRNFAQLAHKLASVFDLALGQGVLSVLPLHHTFEFSCGLLVPFAVGAEITYLDELTADRLGEVLATGRIHAMVGVPALWQLLHRRITQELAARPAWVEKTVESLMAGNRELRDRMGWNLGKLLFWPVHRKLGGNLRVMVSGGSALSEEVHEAFRGLGFDLTEGYGLTEAAPVLTVTPPGETRQSGSVGRALPGIELRIAEPDSSGIGEVLAKGPSVMLGYFGDREATDAVVRDGWLHTGDLGRLDADGNLFLAGRKKDVIIDANGKNVYPDELEELHLRDPPEALRELSIVGLPDEAGGERVACLAVVEKGASRLEVEAHLKTVSETLPFYKRIKVLHLTELELPKTATRKVKRRQVAEELRRLEAAALKGKQAKGRRGTVDAEDWLTELVAQVARKPASLVTGKTRLVHDLGFDSLMLTELSVALEQAGAQLPDGEDVTKLETVAELARAVGRASPPPHREGRSGVEAEGPAAPGGNGEIPVPAPVASAGRALLGAAQRFLYEGLFETRVVGRAYIPQNGNFLVAANHSSHLDMGLVKIALGDQGEKLAALAARDYFFSTPVRRAYFENFTKLIPMDRQGSLKASLRLAGDAIAQGLHLLIFPEGTRSTDGALGEFKPTLGYLALTHSVDVLPAAIIGTHRALPKGRVLPRSRHLEVAFGPPIAAAALAQATAGLGRSEAYRKATAIVQEAVEGLLRSRTPRPGPPAPISSPPAPGAPPSKRRAQPKEMP